MSENMRGAILAWFNAKVDKLEGGVREAGIEALEDGERITKNYIETRGTAKSGKRGRIETGAMLDSVNHSILENSKDEFVGRFGYDDGPFYTVFQELGTSRIEAMYALTDAAEEVFDDLRKEIDKAVRNA